MRSRFALALTAGLCAVLGGVEVRAEPPPDEASVDRSVVAALDDGVLVDWTHLTLQVTRSARGYGVGSSMRAVEQEARRLVGPDMLASARGIAVTADRTYADLEADPSVGEALRSRVERWSVGEARYYASGKVELVGELSLQALLKPWTLGNARPAPVGGEQPRYTGVIVDARGTSLRPAFAPRILGNDGEVLYDGVLWEDVAIDRVPVIYVADPAHPAVARRVGDDPMRVIAASGSGTDVLLTPEDTIRFRTAMREARVMGEGKLVIVLDG